MPPHPRNTRPNERGALIRLASSLPVGDDSRRAILAGLVSSAPTDVWEEDREQLHEAFPPPFRWGYHRTDKASAERAMVRGLGTKNFAVEEHVAYPLFLDLPIKVQKRIYSEMNGPPFYSHKDPRFTNEVEKEYKKMNQYIVWFAQNPEVIRTYGDACLKIDLDKVDTAQFMISDVVFGWGVILDKPIPPEALSRFD